MIRRERKFYSEEFRERVLTAYYNSNESVDMIARRFEIRSVVGFIVKELLPIPKKVVNSWYQV